MCECIYVKNAQGDVVVIYNSLGDLKVSYTYDPWGKLLSVESDFDQYERDVSLLNPFRYRGYYYDNETGLYYLQSRYYDPEVGRFINCDDVRYIGATQTELSYNVFAYCENEPISFIDILGYKKNYSVIKNKYSQAQILKIAYNLYIKSGLFNYKVTISRIKIKNKTIIAAIPNFVWKYYSSNIPNISIIMQANNNGNVRNIGYFGLRSVYGWKEYIINKHRSYILGAKRKIIKALSKKYPNIERDFDAFMFSISEQISDPYIAFAGNILSFIESVLNWMENRLDKEDKYIMSIIKGYNSATKMLILLSSSKYIYSTISYQRGIYWVNETAWHFDKSYYPYK